MQQNYTGNEKLAAGENSNVVYGTPAYVTPQSTPQYAASAPVQYVQPQYGQPQYGQPQYGQPQYGQPVGAYAVKPFYSI
jgi:hypothetical protein